ncbi:MAG: ParB/RepB/Spo0J family partition protein [Thermoproteota archaeon]|nr:ParB/RepB/Spo0J family partition protein [Thermoproteota archaeon]
MVSNSVISPGSIEDISISRLKGSKNIRQDTADLEELIISIQQKGLLQPIIVRTVEGHFEIVAGNRRFQACKSLGWRKITCHVVELDDKQAFEVSLIENLQRKTLSPLDEASSFKAYVSDFGWGGVSELALKVGRSVSYITKRIKLLNLPADVLDSITSHTLDTSIAEELFSIEDKTKQSTLASLIADRRLSLRKARELLKAYDENHIAGAHDEYSDHLKIAERSFNKSITALRIAMNSISEVINNVEHDWILHEVLLQHKNMIHAQIDILIKEKRKL